ncbi:hypothetical protein BaRGS_00025580, partial [Batillaria attramentaria]
TGELSIGGREFASLTRKINRPLDPRPYSITEVTVTGCELNAVDAGHVTCLANGIVFHLAGSAHRVVALVLWRNPGYALGLGTIETVSVSSGLPHLRPACHATYTITMPSRTFRRGGHLQHR